jgi:hypothetical protein
MIPPFEDFHCSVTFFALELIFFAMEAHTVTSVKFPVHCNTMKYQWNE